ncbi:MAG TPA: glucuronate isomerase, partial [Anaerolineae bacterium]
MLKQDRLFDPDPYLKAIALDIYAAIKDTPIISPHGHVDPALFVDPNRRLPNPAELLIQPDHYVLRMLYSQGITYEQLLIKDNPRQIWRLYAENADLFRGTPSGLWLADELETVFDVNEKLSAANADAVYDHIEKQLAQPTSSPRAMFERFNIAVLATTDSAIDTLEHHQAICASGWNARIIPTFRPDTVVNLQTSGWRANIDRLSQVSGIDVTDYASFIRALEQRRQFFKSMGAKATDSGVLHPATDPLGVGDANRIFIDALRGEVTTADAEAYMANMLYELARMS